MRTVGEAGITAWLDGGWAVDALAGRQTREHDDLDLVVDAQHLDRVTQLVESLGYRPIRDELPTAIAFRNLAGVEIDLHPVTITADGGGDQQQPSGRPPWHYGPPVIGHIDGHGVGCCSLETQLRAHQGYPPRDKDRADLAVLAELATQ